MASPFTQSLTNAIVRHLNDDHAMECLLIAQVHGGYPDALTAHLVGFDVAGADFVVGSEDQLHMVRVSFAKVLVHRGEIQEEFSRLVRTAYEA